ncbi:TRAP transporter permease [Candidatus Sumerlaeota bacterium]|nr:TRAP transporter permease [Candidatus Sumerlaeota bacterium]
MTSEPLQTENNDSLDLLGDWAAEEEGLTRRLAGAPKMLAACIAIGWSLFQFAIASKWIAQHFGSLESIYIKAIHLSFALALVFLCSPALKKPRLGLKSLTAMNRVPWYDWLLMSLALGSALYIVFDREGLAARSGTALPRDIVVGVTLLILLLEGCRRAIGPALTMLAAAFIAYAFFAEHMPDILAMKSVSLRRLIGQMTMSDEGVYGLPLRVSAKTVFLFVLFGSMLERAGGGRFFTELVLSVLGGFRGGPAKAAVVSSGLTGMVSGSSIANIVTTGTFTIPLMKRSGYPARTAAAIEVAASTNGQLAPPIMGAAAFIIAEYCNVAYIEVVKAAAIPAFASYAALVYITHLEACKLGLERAPKSELPDFRATLLGGLHYLLPLAVLLYQLIWLQVTPEAAAYYACGMMGVVMLAQDFIKARHASRSVNQSALAAFRNLFAALEHGAKNMVAVALACAGAGVIVGVVSLGLGSQIVNIVDHISRGNVHLMLLITAVASLIIGMGLPTTATYITMASLTAVVIVQLAGKHGIFMPLIAAHLFVFYFGILADDTPPVGLTAYAAAAIAKSPPIPIGIQGFLYDIRTAILPFVFVLNPDLILHNIDGLLMPLLIAFTACAGVCAFAALTQHWFHARNRWYEASFLLIAALVLLRPDATAQLLSIPHAQRYYTAPFALLLLACLYGWQHFRIRKSALRG